MIKRRFQATVAPTTLCASFLVLSLLLGSNAAATDSDVRSGSKLPDLPIAISSFGAAQTEGAVYVFGGHTGRAHQHSFENLSQYFLRYELGSGSEQWEALPPGPPLQGTALVSHEGKLYRVGGLRAENPKESDEILYSVTSAQRFDPETNEWTKLPDLPVGRSSHDLAVLGDSLLVVGGWQMRGPQAPVWSQTVWALDLGTGSEANWTELTTTPDRLRANAAATLDGKLWILGGIDQDGTRAEVHVFDPSTSSWTEGPALPSGGRMKGFAVATLTVGNDLLASPADGKIYRLSDDRTSWVTVGELEAPRFFHRLVGHESSVFAIGGAARRGHLTNSETLSLDDLGLEAASGAASAAMPWRGFLDGFGESSTQLELPLEWSGDTVAWSTTLPGFGHSSPVVWDDTIFVTSVTGTQKDTLWLAAFDVAHGSERWRKSWPASELMESNDMLARAAPTPAIDDERLVLLFGSGDLFAVDHAGERLWHRNLVGEYGTFTGNHGVANSVALSNDAAYVLISRKTYSYLLAVDPTTGENLWKVDRPAGVAWTSPVISPDGREVVVSSSGSLEGYDASSGEQLWILDGLTSNTIITPIVTDDLVIIAGGDRSTNLALERGGRGKLGEENIAWMSPSTAQFSGPSLAEECVYWVNKAGVVQCVDPSNGNSRWTHRLPEALWVPPLVTREHVYFFGEGGSTEILERSGDGPRVVVKNELDLPAQLSAVAVSGSTLLLRSGDRLVAIR